MCDGKGATVTVVKSSDGYIFGGYTDIAWSGDGDGDGDWGNHESAESFLFSLKDHAGIGPVKMPIKSGKTGHAVYHHPSYGPTFGGGTDLFIASNANANTSSSCNIGHTYHHFLAGSKNFTVSEFEIFLV